MSVWPVCYFIKSTVVSANHFKMKYVKALQPMYCHILYLSTFCHGFGFIFKMIVSSSWAEDICHRKMQYIVDTLLLVSDGFQYYSPKFESQL